MLDRAPGSFWAAFSVKLAILGLTDRDSWYHGVKGFGACRTPKIWLYKWFTGLFGKHGTPYNHPLVKTVVFRALSGLLCYSMLDGRKDDLGRVWILFGWQTGQDSRWQLLTSILCGASLGRSPQKTFCFESPSCGSIHPLLCLLIGTSV